MPVLFEILLILVLGTIESIFHQLLDLFRPIHNITSFAQPNKLEIKPGTINANVRVDILAREGKREIPTAVRDHFAKGFPFTGV